MGDVVLRAAMGPSGAVNKVITDLMRVAPTDFTVVITGETGAGKELVARGIHQHSRRTAGPFIPLDCGAVQPTLIESELFGHEKGAFTGADRARPGKFEAATGGTLFLDEIQNLPLTVQTKLLRALQEREICRVGGTQPQHIDLRVIAATNQDLPSQVANGCFRQDLFHRLNEFSIHIPSLRQRREDIVYLAQRFMAQACQELHKEIKETSSQAVQMLLSYPWPGNVRELRNVIRRATLLADTHIGTEHLGPLLQSAPTDARAEEFRADGKGTFKELVRQNIMVVEKEILVRVLRQTGGNKARAARLLQIDYKTMLTKIRQYGLCQSCEK